MRVCFGDYRNNFNYYVYVKPQGTQGILHIHFISQNAEAPLFFFLIKEVLMCVWVCVCVCKKRREIKLPLILDQELWLSCQVMKPLMHSIKRQDGISQEITMISVTLSKNHNTIYIRRCDWQPNPVLMGRSPHTVSKAVHVQIKLTAVNSWCVLTVLSPRKFLRFKRWWKYRPLMTGSSPALK